MEAKDIANETVMSKELQEFYKDNQLAGLEWQAEVSFKAGRILGQRDTWDTAVKVAGDAGKQEERKSIQIELRQHWTEYDTTKAPKWVRATISGTQEFIESILGKPNSRNGR